MPGRPSTLTAIIPATFMHLATAGEHGDHAGHLIARYLPAYHLPTRPSRDGGVSTILDSAWGDQAAVAAVW